MKVKIRDTIYDASEEPIMLILDTCDKYNISRMATVSTKYCAYPDGWAEEKIKQFMNTDPPTYDCDICKDTGIVRDGMGYPFGCAVCGRSLPGDKK